MTETPDTKTPPAGATPPVKGNRLYQAAAWVVIVAGTVFIVSTIFVAGAYVSNGGWRNDRQHGPCMMHMGPPPGPGPDIGPGPAGPGHGPGGPGGHHPMPPRP